MPAGWPNACASAASCFSTSRSRAAEPPARPGSCSCEAAFEACRPAFGAFASDIFHLGAAGAGQVGKMVNNLILWTCIVANDEGLGLPPTDRRGRAGPQGTLDPR